MPLRSDPEVEGGDPPCWAHLFEETCLNETLESNLEGHAMAAVPDADDQGLVDLLSVTRLATAEGAVWTRQSEDLNVNLLVFAAGEGVAEHLNSEVDVLLVGIAGAGTVEIDGMRHVLRTGNALVIPKGARRSTWGLSDPFAYLTCHRRRDGIWPSHQP